MRARVRHPLLWSPLLALLVQLVLIGAAAAGTGGGNFPT